MNLIVFGDSTANEIIPVAKVCFGDRLEHVRRVFFDAESDVGQENLQWIKQHSQVHYICGIVDIKLRMQVQEFASQHGLLPISVIDPTAVVAQSATVGQGCFIAAYAVISENATIGDFSIVHFHCSIGHDAKLGKNCTVLPGARVSGDVKFGDGVLLGSNSFVFQGVTIGSFTQVDALTYVRRDLPANMLHSCFLDKPIQRTDQ